MNTQIAALNSTSLYNYNYLATISTVDSFDNSLDPNSLALYLNGPGSPFKTNSMPNGLPDIFMFTGASNTPNTETIGNYEYYKIKIVDFVSGFTLRQNDVGNSSGNPYDYFVSSSASIHFTIDYINSVTFPLKLSFNYATKSN